MTDRRDLKRRVRDRQERTGESYMTALRHVRDGRHPVPVVEMLDVTEIAAQLGLRCRVTMEPDLADLASDALTRFAALLRTTAHDPELARMRDAALFGLPVPLLKTAGVEGAFSARVRAGLGGVSDSGNAVAIAVRDVMIVFTLYLVPPIGTCARLPQLFVGRSSMWSAW
jgi:hypothetical protein